MTANWIATSWNSRGDHWYLSGANNPIIEKRFIWAAERGAAQLGHSDISTALAFWLDRLRSDSPYFSGTLHQYRQEDGTYEADGGVIYRVCEASADYCLKLEAEMIARTNRESGRLAGRQRSQATRSRRPPRLKLENDAIKTRIREIVEEAVREGAPLTNLELCRRLDARKVALPKTTTWGEDHNSWTKALRADEGAVKTYLSRAKPRYRV